MFLLFEEAGKIMAGRVLSEAESSAQVELEISARMPAGCQRSIVRASPSTIQYSGTPAR